jgi:hypothetical protein
MEAHYHAFAVGWVMDAGRRPAGAARDGPASSAWAETSLFFQEGKDAERPRMWPARSAPDEEAPRFSAFWWE